MGNNFGVSGCLCVIYFADLGLLGWSLGEFGSCWVGVWRFVEVFKSGFSGGNMALEYVVSKHV